MLATQSISKSPEENRLIGLCEKHLLDQEVRVVDLDLKVGPRSLLRVYIEKTSGEGVSLENCGDVTRVLSPVLENESIPSPYTFEVSSPGLDRRLRLTPDFEKAVGSTIKLVLKEAVEGFGANIHGKLIRVSHSGVTVLVPGKPEREFVFTNIKQANRVWE